MKKFKAALALTTLLTVSGCAKKEEINFHGEEYYKSIYPEMLSFSTSKDENGMLVESIEVSPLIRERWDIHPCQINKRIDGEIKAVDSKCYRGTYEYFAPANVNRIEGTGADMRCFIDYGWRCNTTVVYVDGKRQYDMAYSWGILPERKELQNKIPSVEGNNLKLTR